MIFCFGSQVRQGMEKHIWMKSLATDKSLNE